MISLRLLGEIELMRGGERVALPPSKKTRALLAYLAATGKVHRRERLCAMFWEIPDDPRGALRWSLSRMRALVDEPDATRIVATRETVAFDPAGMDIDLIKVRRMVDAGFPALPMSDLEALAGAFHGEFLEGLDLPDAHDFQAWCLAEREDLRRLQARVLTLLVGQLVGRPDHALTFARRLVQIDPFNEAARTSLLQMLMALGRRTEAEQHYEAAVRVLKELGDGSELGLMRHWRELRERTRSPPETEPRPTPSPSLRTPAETFDNACKGHAVATDRPLIGRADEWRMLIDTVEAAVRERRTTVVLLTGEPGLGKSRLIEDLVRHAQSRGIRALSGRAYEAERSNPFGPWIEILAGPEGATSEPAALFAGRDAAESTTHEIARNQLFARVAQRIFGADVSNAPLLVTLDDIQWCDEASADLLHYLVRSHRHAPFVVVLAARDGELADNPQTLGVLRSLRHARLVTEIGLAALSQADVEQLVRSFSPNLSVSRIAAQCAGNPLFAIELACNAAERADELPRSLKDSVRDRLARLPGPAADLLRWASVLGTSLTVDRLAKLEPLDLDELAAALEVVERHGLLRVEPSAEGKGAYRFAHDLVHRAIYTDISEPRRRLMHRKVAQSLQGASDNGDETMAVDVAHHAALSGDAGMAAAACVAAGRRCLRLFAATEAETLARRGLRYAETLAEPERTMRTLELARIEIMARRPIDVTDAIARIEALAERALDQGCLEHARLGFHVLSHLRWESGLWSDAHRDTMRAAFVSRSADERGQVIALAEAARCLAMLERDLGHADALALEAKALGHRLGVEPDALADASGLLHWYRGADDEAAALFRHARELARRDGERESEFLALEHRAVLELRRGRHAEAETLCTKMIVLAERLREGSERPFARALQCICQAERGNSQTDTALENAIAALRLADAKHRLGVVLTDAAELDREHGDLERAKARAEEALELAKLLMRTSDIVAAHAILARIAFAAGDIVAHNRHVSDLRDWLAKPVPNRVRTEAEAILEEFENLTPPSRTAPPQRRAGAARIAASRARDDLKGDRRT